MTMRLARNFSGYLWATWTTMEAQPMQIDSALQAMIDQSTTSDVWARLALAMI